MRSLKLTHLERALVRKLYARRYTVVVLTRMFRCCQTTINRSIRNHMDDDVNDDDAIISNADLPADLSAMLGLKEPDEDKAAPASPNKQCRPWAPTKGLIVPRKIATVPRLASRTSSKVSVGHYHPITDSA
jgi:hypothetical protein